MLILLSGLLAAAQTSAASPPAKEDDPVVCHRPESEVGSHMRPKPVCMKKSEWDYIEKQSRAQLQRMDEHQLDPGRAEGHGPH